MIEHAMLTRKEAAAYLGITPQTLAHWAYKRPGYLPHIKLGGAVRYLRSDVLAFIEQQRTAAPQQEQR